MCDKNWEVLNDYSPRYTEGSNGLCSNELWCNGKRMDYDRVTSHSLFKKSGFAALFYVNYYVKMYDCLLPTAEYDVHDPC